MRFIYMYYVAVCWSQECIFLKYWLLFIGWWRRGKGRVAEEFVCITYWWWEEIISRIYFKVFGFWKIGFGEGVSNHSGMVELCTCCSSFLSSQPSSLGWMTSWKTVSGLSIRFLLLCLCLISAEFQVRNFFRITFSLFTSKWN